MATASSASVLSDAELRDELKRLGFNAGPVTGSTRPLLIKKLLKLQGSDKQLPKVTKKSVPSRKLLGFSSDESDSENNGNVRSRNTVQYSTSAKNVRRRSLQPRKRTTDHVDSPSINNTDFNSKKPNAMPKSSQRSRLSLGSRRSSLRGSTDTSRDNSRLNKSTPHAATGEFSDSDLDIDKQTNGILEDDSVETAEMGINTSRATTSMISNRSSVGLGRRTKNTIKIGGNSFNSTYSLHDEDLNDQTPEAESAIVKPFFNKTPRTSTPRRPTRSRLNDQTSPKKINNTSSCTVTVPEDGMLNKRYNSNTTNASFSWYHSDDLNIRKARSPPSAYETNHTGSSLINQNRDNPITGDTHLEKEFATEEKLGSSLGSKYGHSYIPMVLLMCAFLFFVSLAVMYFSVGALDRNADLKDERYLLCSDDNKDECSNPVAYANAMKIVVALYDKLSELAGLAECVKDPDSVQKNMTVQEVKRFLNSFKAEVEHNPFWVEDSLHIAWKLIAHNEQWGLRLFGIDGQLSNATNEDELKSKVIWVHSTHPHMPWLCRVQRSAVLVLFRVCMIILVVLLCWLLILYVRYRLRREEEEKDQVHQLVEKIIEMLSSHSRACCKDKSLQDKSLPPYLAIPHVRDTLIPLAERRKKQKLWNRAVQFLNANESRVRVETQQVSGEEFPVWRWVQPASVVTNQSFAPITEQDTNPNRLKVWQGTAFDNIDTAVKAPSYTPTPCLKIRNMFDITLESGANWHVGIEDAILEKCVGNDGIVHIAVDKNSREGCVYMKCSTPENAGRAYRALQGGWFDGKLVTVKYLRLDRYHQRFPPAINCISPLQPSNNLKKSLSRPPHSSALESS